MDAGGRGARKSLALRYIVVRSTSGRVVLRSFSDELLVTPQENWWPQILGGALLVCGGALMVASSKARAMVFGSAFQKQPQVTPAHAADAGSNGQTEMAAVEEVQGVSLYTPPVVEVVTPP